MTEKAFSKNLVCLFQGWDMYRGLPRSPLCLTKCPYLQKIPRVKSSLCTITRTSVKIWVHAFPFYKKRSYKKRPIKFFNHKKPWPIEFSIIRNDVLTTREWIIEMFVIFKIKMPKGWWFNQIKFKSDNSHVLIEKNIQIFLKWRGICTFEKNIWKI